jgi:hypothetical protein
VDVKLKSTAAIWPARGDPTKSMQVRWGPLAEGGQKKLAAIYLPRCFVLVEEQVVSRRTLGMTLSYRQLYPGRRRQLNTLGN